MARQRPAVRFAALFALLLQIFLVQTHVHPATPPLSFGVERVDASGGDSPGAEVSALDDHQRGCAFCDALATAGAGALPTAPSLAQAEPTRAEAAALAIAQAPRAHTHSWRSRAPPAPLQA